MNDFIVLTTGRVINLSNVTTFKTKNSVNSPSVIIEFSSSNTLVLANDEAVEFLLKFKLSDSCGVVPEEYNKTIEKMKNNCQGDLQ